MSHNIEKTASINLVGNLILNKMQASRLPFNEPVRRGSQKKRASRVTIRFHAALFPTSMPLGTVVGGYLRIDFRPGGNRFIPYDSKWRPFSKMAAILPLFPLLSHISGPKCAILLIQMSFVTNWDMPGLFPGVLEVIFQVLVFFFEFLGKTRF